MAIAIPNFIEAKNLAKVDIPKEIIGKWEGETKGANGRAIETIAFYADNQFRSEVIVFLKDGKTVNINYGGNYTIDRNKISYVTESTDKPDICPIGGISIDTVVRVKKNQFVYQGKSGNRVYLDRVE